MGDIYRSVIPFVLLQAYRAGAMHDLSTDRALATQFDEIIGSSFP